MAIKHTFECLKPDGPDPGKVNASNWNEPHEIEPGTFMPNAPIFSSGIDGALAFDGVATVLGMAPATVGSFKVYTLTRDLHAASITIAASVKIFTANWRIFCRGAITGASQTTSIIHNNGLDAPVAVAGAGIANASFTASAFFDVTLPGNSGSGGNATNNPPPPYGITAAGAAAGGGAVGSATPGTTSSTPMQGGGGGGVSNNSGGTSGVSGGSNTASSAALGYDHIQQLLGRSDSGGTAYRFGSGGGQGVGTAQGAGIVTNPTGGGGGGGAGCCYVAAQTLSTLTISAIGGAGADGAIGVGATGTAASGGGGGGGGIVIVQYATRDHVTLSAAGGAGGAGNISGTLCHAAAGGNGSPGWTIAYNLSGDGT
jgi:hypothetical protein